MLRSFRSGYTLDEIQNDITKETPASFEPTIDYVVVKIPRFTFEKFKEAKPILDTQMRSIGETMAIGRTFKEAFQKGMRSLEKNYIGMDSALTDKVSPLPADFRRIIDEKLRIPGPDRMLYISDAIKQGYTIEEICHLTAIDPWFIKQMIDIYAAEKAIKGKKLTEIDKSTMKEYKQYGFSDRKLASLLEGNPGELELRDWRKKLGVLPTYKLVDTCAAEFQAKTPYYYSTYEDEDEANPGDRRKVMILGSGPNRIGQGIEFDYACVHCSLALRDAGYETIMVNSNPETVSTDYDISDKLYFEPLTFEDVMNIYENEKPLGIVLQFGGQTPLNLAGALEKAGVKILGTSSESINLAEDREEFRQLIQRLKLLQPPSATAKNLDEALEIAKRIGYPVLARPSFVLGGRAMLIVFSEQQLRYYVETEKDAFQFGPILIDRYLEDAQEIDVDAIGDGENVVVAGILQHIEEAGVHSGDSAMILPPITLDRAIVQEVERQSVLMGKALKVKGLMNIQFAVKDGEIYFLEVNPRSSRTVPFVSKATGIPWAKKAAQDAGRQYIERFGNIRI